MIFVEISERPCEPTLNWLRSLKGVYDVSSLTGDIDAVISVSVPTTEELSFINDLIGKDERISSAVSQLVLSTR